jgi:sec-independent protein translocase protein TatA
MHSTLYLAIPGFGELWPILLIVLVLFGARKLPELARAMGSSITQFKRGLKDEKEAPDQIPEGSAAPDAENRSE